MMRSLCAHHAFITCSLCVQAAQLEERRYELHWQQWQLVEDEQSPAVWGNPPWQRFERPCFDGDRTPASLRASEASPWHDDRGETDHTLGRSWPAPSPNSRRASAPSVLGHV